MYLKGILLLDSYVKVRERERFFSFNLQRVLLASFPARGGVSIIINTYFTPFPSTAPQYLSTEHLHCSFAPPK